MQDYKFTRDTYMDAYNTDIARRATAGGVLRQFNETATRNMAHFGASYDELLDSGRALMVSRMDIEILEPPLMEEPVQASTRCTPQRRSHPPLLRDLQGREDPGPGQLGLGARGF